MTPVARNILALAFVAGELQTALGFARQAFKMTLDTAIGKGSVFFPGENTLDSRAIGMPVVHRYLKGDRPTGEHWVMWYQGRGDDIEEDVLPLSTGRILRAESEDGIHWTRMSDNEALALDRNEEDWWSFDTAHVGLGDVVSVAKDDSGVADQSQALFMYTYGGDWSETRPGMKGGRMKIGVAVSQDGINWSRIEGDGPNGESLEVGNVGEWDSLYVGWPQVVPCVTNEKEFSMYYCSFDEIEKKHCVGMAVGPDGVRWTKKGKIFSGSDKPGAFDEGGVSRRHILPGLSGGYHMWYEGVSKQGTHSIGYATSEDGITWTPMSDKAVFEPAKDSEAWDAGGVSSPRVVRLGDGSMRMYYVGYSSPEKETGGGGAPKRGAIGVAVNLSGDGLTWERV